jgi:hypothetical protein
VTLRSCAAGSAHANRTNPARLRERFAPSIIERVARRMRRPVRVPPGRPRSSAVKRAVTPGAYAGRRTQPRSSPPPVAADPDRGPTSPRPRYPEAACQACSSTSTRSGSTRCEAPPARRGRSTAASSSISISSGGPAGRCTSPPPARRACASSRGDAPFANLRRFAPRGFV